MLFRDRKETDNSNLVLNMIHYHLPERHIRDYLHSSQFYYDPHHYKVKVSQNETVDPARRTPWVIVLEFNWRKLTIARLWEEIVEKVEKYFKDVFEVVEFREFMENNITSNPLIYLRLLDAENYVGKGDKIIFNTLMKKEYEAKCIPVGGITGIKSAKTGKKFVMDAPPHLSTSNPAVKEDYTYTIFETDGTNLRACLSHPLIDSRKTYSNDMNEIYRVLGIEAARQCFINEFK